MCVVRCLESLLHCLQQAQSTGDYKRVTATLGLTNDFSRGF